MLMIKNILRIKTEIVVLSVCMCACVCFLHLFIKLIVSYW